MQVSGQGQDGIGGMTTQGNLPQEKTGTARIDGAAPNYSDQPQKHILVKNSALSSVLSSQSGSCLCGSTSERGRKGSERMTGRGGRMGAGGGAKRRALTNEVATLR